MDYYSPFWVPEAISIVVEPKDALTCRSSTLAVLADSGPFCGLLLAVSGPGGISTIDEPLVRLCFGHQQSRFLSILSLSWTITHRFGVLKRFPLLSNPKVCLRVGRQVSQFWPILARFLDYYSVLGSRSDFHDYEPQGTFTCHSSTLTILAYSGPFHALLLSVLGSQSYFHGCRTQDVLICWSSRLAVLADSGPFLGLLLSFAVPK